MERLENRAGGEEVHRVFPILMPSQAVAVDAEAVAELAAVMLAVVDTE